MAAEAESMLAKVTLDCGGHITSSQEETLATSAFLGGLPASPSASDEEEVFSTPPDATQQQDDDPVTMCTLPFTPTPSKSPAAPPAGSGSSSSGDAPPANPRRKPRVCTRKVRGARIRTPTPSPEQQPQPEHHPQPEQQQTEAEEPIHVDPLIRAVLMMPTATTTATTGTTSNQDPVEAFLALARRKGLI